MSRVYFADVDGEAELFGAERHYAGYLTNSIALAALNPRGYRMVERLKPLMPADHYLSTVIDDDNWAEAFETWWRTDIGNDSDSLFCGHPTGDLHLQPWLMTLNTALVAGSSAIELLARIHATCEIHGYVEGEHRGWLADMIDEGREDKVLRSNAGWENVAELLRKTDEGPVVMSYSVCATFPDEGLVVAAGVWKRSDEENEDEWYDVPTDERWRLGVEALRKTSAGKIDLHPEMWGVRGFGDPAWSVFDLLEHI